MTMNTKINELKESGNEAFKKGEYGVAVQYYSDAIVSLVSREQSDQEIAAILKAEDALQKCYNNRSQCYLKLGKFAKAADDASKGDNLSSQSFPLDLDSSRAFFQCLLPCPMTPRPCSDVVKRTKSLASLRTR